MILRFLLVLFFLALTAFFDSAHKEFQSDELNQIIDSQRKIIDHRDKSIRFAIQSLAIQEKIIDNQKKLLKKYKEQIYNAYIVNFTYEQN